MSRVQKSGAIPIWHVVWVLAMISVFLEVSNAQSSVLEEEINSVSDLLKHERGSAEGLFGHAHGLTEEQKKILGKFRAQVTPHLDQADLKDDFYLIRWLEAKDWKVADAEAMLTRNLQWRKQNRMDKIQDENWTDMMREYPYRIDTIDKKGRPVGTLSAKNWDILRAVTQGRVPRLQRYMYKMLEDLTDRLHEARKTNKNVTQWSAIINADGFGLFQHACPSCIPVWMNFVKSASEHYPGFAESISVINVPRPLIRILRPILASNSLKIFDNEKSTWMKYLDEKIDKSQRWPEYGGNKGK